MSLNNPVFKGKTVIGVTGTIASGKSTICRYMASTAHALRIDADLVGRRTVEDMKNELAKVFGEKILSEEGTINRKALGAIVFGSEEKLKQLNGMVHPEICRRIGAMIERAEEKVILVEAIELLRSDLKDMIDAVVVIYAEPEIRIRRMMQERNLTEAEAASRVHSQLDDETYRSRADFLIRSGDGPLEQLYLQCDRILKEITGDSCL